MWASSAGRSGLGHTWGAAILNHSSMLSYIQPHAPQGEKPQEYNQGKFCFCPVYGPYYSTLIQDSLADLSPEPFLTELA